MPRLENPETFNNVVKTTTSLNGDVKDVEAVVASAPIVAYYNSADPMPEDPKEALKTLKKLTLDVGEIKDFTQQEADFLVKHFPWLEYAGNKAVQKGSGALAEMEMDMLKERAGAEARSHDVNVNVDIG